MNTWKIIFVLSLLIASIAKAEQAHAQSNARQIESIDDLLKQVMEDVKKKQTEKPSAPITDIETDFSMPIDCAIGTKIALKEHNGESGKIFNTEKYPRFKRLHNEGDIKYIQCRQLKGDIVNISLLTYVPIRGPLYTYDPVTGTTTHRFQHGKIISYAIYVPKKKILSRIYQR